MLKDLVPLPSFFSFVPGKWWGVKKLDNGNYKFLAMGAVVGGFAGSLFAYPNPVDSEAELATTEWTFQRDVLNPNGHAYVYVLRAFVV